MLGLCRNSLEGNCFLPTGSGLSGAPSPASRVFIFVCLLFSCRASVDLSLPVLLREKQVSLRENRVASSSLGDSTMGF